MPQFASILWKIFNWYRYIKGWESAYRRARWYHITAHWKYRLKKSLIPQYCEPTCPPPSKIILSEIFNLYELSNYMKKKKNDQNRISVLPECPLKAERNLFYRSSRRKEFYNLARFWKWSTDSYPLTLKLIRGGREVLRWCGFARFCCGFCGNFYFKLRYWGFTKPSGLRYLEIFE